MKSFLKKLLIIKIEEGCINFVQAKNKRILSADTVAIPDEVFKNGEIKDIDFLCDKIENYIETKKLRNNGIIFLINGSDVILRHTEVPIMKKENILDAAKWEMMQYLPQGGENHYIDYEIISKENSDTRKVYNVLVCAAPKEKIDKYIKIAEDLHLQLIGINVEEDSIAKIFEHVYIEDNSLDDLGIIKIGKSMTEFIILKNGKLHFQREIPFGKDNIDFKTKEDLDKILNSFSKFTQFYFTNKTKKTMDKTFVVGIDKNINGLEEYLENYLDTEVDAYNNSIYSGINISFESGFDIKKYMDLFGVVLCNENNSVNLMPHTSLKENYNYQMKKYSIIAGGSVVAIMILVALSLCIYSLKLKSDYNKVQYQLKSYSSVKSKNTKILSEIKSINNNIGYYNKLKNNGSPTSQWVAGMQKYIPEDVKLSSIVEDKSKKEYKILGTAVKVDSVAIFAANLNSDANYRTAQVTNLSNDTNSNSSNTYDFTITIIGGDNK